MFNAKNGSVAIGNDRMSYVSFGRGQKNLVILPGLSDGLATVKGKALVLAAPYRLFFEKYKVYMFSRRDGLERGTSIRDMARDQAEAMKQLGIDRASVLGVSQGGMIAQYLAIDHPDMVDRLVLAVTAPCINEIAKERIDSWIGFAKEGNHKGLMVDTAENSYSPQYLVKYRGIYPLIGLIGRPANYERFYANAEAILSFDALDELEKIQCPTLIIAGEKDKIVGLQSSYDLQSRIKDSSLFIYKGLGHGAYEEAKDFNRRVFAFLESNIG